jgi:hypothetical protein
MLSSLEKIVAELICLLKSGRLLMLKTSGILKKLVSSPGTESIDTNLKWSLRLIVTTELKST